MRTEKGWTLSLVQLCAIRLISAVLIVAPILPASIFPVFVSEAHSASRSKQLAAGTSSKVGGLSTGNIMDQAQTNMYIVRNYAGKCLDYGAPWQGSGPTVFLNNCAVAHPIQVQEINDKHEVILQAGKQVIGVRNPAVISKGGASAPQQIEYGLELQNYNPILASTANQIFRLDGDSIIWESSPPCLNTETSLCTPNPPQLVIQIQNARGANGSPLVASLRNLTDAEFWDFQAQRGSKVDPTQGFVRVATNYDLWNAFCQTPTVKRSGGVPVIDDPGQPDDGQIAFSGPFGNGPFSGCNTPKAGWGTVVVVSDDPNECTAPETTGSPFPNVGPCIDMSYYPPLLLPAGVTLRGDRRGSNFGPQLYFFYINGRPNASACTFAQCMLLVQGDYVRVTGLRLRGQSRSTDPTSPATTAVVVDYPPGSPSAPLFSVTTMTEFIATIDHNDISDWGEAAISVRGPYVLNPYSGCSITVNGGDKPSPCDGKINDQKTGQELTITDAPATLSNVQVVRNFLHHNEKDNGGYGAALGRAVIVGNTFLMNRHAITADGEPHNEYRASFNLVMTNVPVYTGTCVLDVCSHYQNQDFDMHGTADPDHFFGGLGGYYVDIVGNTFLGSNHPNFELRGFPRVDANFDDNVSTQSQNDSVDFKVCPNVCISGPNGVPIITSGHHFGVANPVTAAGPASLAVGDFDGDGQDDLFLATGAAWYYSPAGAREWRFLRADPTPIGQLLFGDFDGDGRTDVVTMQRGKLMVSWGGISNWEVLNPKPGISFLPDAITQMAVGDFDGDGTADIFFADGKTWFVSYGGNTPFVMVQTSSFRVKDVRFGDFDGNGTTDVFGVEGGNWSVSFSKKSFRGLFGSWQKLRTKLTNAVDGLFVADFSGTGQADIASDCGANSPGCWRISRGGTQDWSNINFGTGPYVAGVGHFRGHRIGGHYQADLLLWNAFDLFISAGGTAPPISYSSQDMH